MMYEECEQLNYYYVSGICSFRNDAIVRGFIGITGVCILCTMNCKPFLRQETGVWASSLFGRDVERRDFKVDFVVPVLLVWNDYKTII